MSVGNHPSNLKRVAAIELPQATPDSVRNGCKIFINYRRDADWGFAQAHYQLLKIEFPREVSMDGHIKPGEDFVEVLNDQAAACEVDLVVIGPDPEDFVLIEIRTALELGRRVIPVLVGGARMPPHNSLPESIRRLARYNAIDVTPRAFEADAERLVMALKEQLAIAEAARTLPTRSEPHYRQG
jgi:hypothetical protein